MRQNGKTATPSPRRAGRSRRQRKGWASVALAILLLLALLGSCADGNGGGAGESGTLSGEESFPPGTGGEENTEQTEGNGAETDPGEETVKTKRVIMLAGQSNAVGHSHAKFLPDAAGKISPERVAEMKKGYKNIQIMYSNNFYRPSKSGNGHFTPVNFGCGMKATDITFGPEVGIAEYLNENYPGEEFYIIKCATGATTLFEDWNPTLENEKENLYAQMLTFTSEALGQLTADGSKAEIIAFCWMQGESDCGRGQNFYKDPLFAEYNDLFGQLIDGFSEKFAAYLPEGGLPVIQGGISSYWTGAARFNSAKQQFAKDRENAYYFATYDLTYNVDNTDYAHFDAAAMILLGNRFGEYVAKTF